MNVIGIDNGVTNNGLGVVSSDGRGFLFSLPTKNEFSYTKEKKVICRIDNPKLIQVLKEIQALFPGEEIMAVIERPLVNPRLFVATLSALRAVESTQIALEACGIPYCFQDSKGWQRALLPAEAKGPSLKTESLRVAKSLYPSLPFKKDGDGILIAHYAQQVKLQPRTEVRKLHSRSKASQG